MKPKVPPYQDLNDPNLDDQQFLGAANAQGASLGGPQWQSHSNARRDKTFNDAFQGQFNSDPNYDPLNMNMHEAMRSQAQSAAIDPSGVMGMFAANSNGAFADDTKQRQREALGATDDPRRITPNTVMPRLTNIMQGLR